MQKEHYVALGPEAIGMLMSAGRRLGYETVEDALAGAIGLMAAIEPLSEGGRVEVVDPNAVEGEADTVSLVLSVCLRTS
jgi:hypothetical protein